MSMYVGSKTNICGWLRLWVRITEANEVQSQDVYFIGAKLRVGETQSMAHGHRILFL